MRTLQFSGKETFKRMKRDRKGNVKAKRAMLLDAKVHIHNGPIAVRTYGTSMDVTLLEEDEVAEYVSSLIENGYMQDDGIDCDVTTDKGGKRSIHYGNRERP